MNKIGVKTYTFPSHMCSHRLFRKVRDNFVTLKFFFEKKNIFLNCVDETKPTIAHDFNFENIYQSTDDKQKYIYFIPNKLILNVNICGQDGVY